MLPTELFEQSSVSVADAQKCCHQFWQHHNSEDGYPEHYPEEEVIRFLGGMRAAFRGKERKARILDLGSGSGKHSVLIAEMGHEAYCVDWSEPGLAYTKKRLTQAGYEADLRVSDFSSEPLPYEDGFFDGIIAMQVFDHLIDADAKKLLGEVRRILAPNGRMLASLMSDQTSKKNRLGVPVDNEDLTYLVSCGNSAGEIHRLFTYEKMDAFWKGQLSIDRAMRMTMHFETSDETAECKYFTLSKGAQ